MKVAERYEKEAQTIMGMFSGDGTLDRILKKYGKSSVIATKDDIALRALGRVGLVNFGFNSAKMKPTASLTETGKIILAPMVSSPPSPKE